MLGTPLCPIAAASRRASRRPTEEALGLSSCSTVWTTFSSRSWGLLCFRSSLVTSAKQLTWYVLHTTAAEPGSCM